MDGVAIEAIREKGAFEVAGDAETMLMLLVSLIMKLLVSLMMLVQMLVQMSVQMLVH